MVGQGRLSELGLGFFTVATPERFGTGIISEVNPTNLCFLRYPIFVAKLVCLYRMIKNPFYNEKSLFGLTLEQPKKDILDFLSSVKSKAICIKFAAKKMLKILLLHRRECLV